ncbi:hypothetical protein L1887_55269 [Cichorium endivia]|nr:hypothetical protein L1887_55269 [Cichorium endivia]
MPELPQTRQHARCTARHRVTRLSMRAMSADLIIHCASPPAMHRFLVCRSGNIVLPDRTELRVAPRLGRLKPRSRPILRLYLTLSPFPFATLRRELLKRLCCLHV